MRQLWDIWDIARLVNVQVHLETGHKVDKQDIKRLTNASKGKAK